MSNRACNTVPFGTLCATCASPQLRGYFEDFEGVRRATTTQSGLLSTNSVEEMHGLEHGRWLKQQMLRFMAAEAAKQATGN